MTEPTHHHPHHAPHHPLAHLALSAGPDAETAGAGVVLQALPFCPSMVLRGESSDANFTEAFHAALGFDLPLKPNHVTRWNALAALWMGPNEWLLLGAADGNDLSASLADHRHAIIPNGDGQQIIALSGGRAAEVLAKLCPLDLDDGNLVPGRCARSVLAGIGVLVVPQPDGVYQIHVARSFADYAWRILADASQEFGLAVADADGRKL